MLCQDKGMDKISKETVDQLQKQLADIAMKIQALSANLDMLTCESEEPHADMLVPILEGKISDAGNNSIRENSIICLECGKICRVLTWRHLTLHGHTAHTYRMKWHLEENVPLMCTSLLQSRKKRMKEMKLWERSKESRQKRRKD